MVHRGRTSTGIPALRQASMPPARHPWGKLVADAQELPADLLQVLGPLEHEDQGSLEAQDAPAPDGEGVPDARPR
jgi:hypothetical protein